MTSKIRKSKDKNESGKIVITDFMRVSQGEGMGEFLVCIVDPRDLLNATMEFPRRYDPEEDSYIGIQRPLKEEKLKEIRDYIKNDPEACFPNSIIANLDTSFICNEEEKLIEIDLERKNEEGEIEKPIFIIDGQHRLYSFKEENMPNNFQLIMVLFKGLELPSQAYLFSTINDKQQRLNSSQVQDLNEIMYIETPEKIVHRFTRIFNENKESPWVNKINILGEKIKKKDGEVIYGTMSQYSFAKEIIKLIYPNKKYFKIRNLVKKIGSRKQLEKIPELNVFSRKYPFWDYYVEEDDEKMMKILLNYFSSMEKNFGKDWRDNSKIITKTTGYIAFMRLLKDICSEKKEAILEYDFNPLIKKIIEEKNKDLEKRDFINTNYPAGAKGQKLLYDFISEIYKDNNF